MHITVKLYAGLRRFGPAAESGAGFLLQVPVGSDVGKLLEQLHVPDGAPVVAMVNQEVAEGPDHRLADGDVVSLFPPIAGG